MSKFSKITRSNIKTPEVNIDWYFKPSLKDIRYPKRHFYHKEHFIKKQQEQIKRNALKLMEKPAFQDRWGRGRVSFHVSPPVMEQALNTLTSIDIRPDHTNKTILDSIVILFGRGIYHVLNLFKKILTIFKPEERKRAFDEIIDLYRDSDRWHILLVLYLAADDMENEYTKKTLLEELVDYLKSQSPDIIDSINSIWFYMIYESSLEKLASALPKDHAISLGRYIRNRRINLLKGLDLDKEDMIDILHIREDRPPYYGRGRNNHIAKRFVAICLAEKDYESLVKHSEILGASLYPLSYLKGIFTILSQDNDLVNKFKGREIDITDPEEIKSLFNELWKNYFGWETEEISLHVKDGYYGRFKKPRALLITSGWIDVEKGEPSVKSTIEQIFAFCEDNTKPKPSREDFLFTQKALGLSSKTIEDSCKELFIRGSKLIEKHPELKGKDIEPNKIYPSIIVTDNFSREIPARIIKKDLIRYDDDRKRVHDLFDLSDIEVVRDESSAIILNPKNDQIENLDRLCQSDLSQHVGVTRYLRKLLDYLGISYLPTDNNVELCGLIGELRQKLKRKWSIKELRIELGCKDEDEECLEDPLSLEEIDSPHNLVKIPETDRYVVINNLVDFWVKRGCINLNLEVDSDKECRSPIDNKELTLSQVKGILAVVKRYRSQSKYFEKKETDFILATLLSLKPETRPKLEEILQIADLLGKKMKATIPTAKQRERLVALLSKQEPEKLDKILPELTQLIDEIKTTILSVYALTGIENWNLDLKPEQMLDHFGLTDIKFITSPFTNEIAKHPFQVIKVGKHYIHFKELLNKIELIKRYRYFKEFDWKDWSKIPLPILSPKETKEVQSILDNMKIYDFLYRDLKVEEPAREAAQEQAKQQLREKEVELSLDERKDMVTGLLVSYGLEYLASLGRDLDRKREVISMMNGHGIPRESRNALLAKAKGKLKTKL